MSVILQRDNRPDLTLGITGSKAENPAETKLMLEGILCRYSNGNLMSDIALCEIRGRVIDHMRMMDHDKMGHYDENSESS